MPRHVAQMTTEELQELIETTIEQKLFELFEDPDTRLVLRKPLRDRLVRQQAAVAAGERGEDFQTVITRLGLP